MRQIIYTYNWERQHVIRIVILQKYKWLTRNLEIIIEIQNKAQSLHELLKRHLSIKITHDASIVHQSLNLKEPYALKT